MRWGNDEKESWRFLEIMSANVCELYEQDGERRNSCRLLLPEEYVGDILTGHLRIILPPANTCRNPFPWPPDHVPFPTTKSPPMQLLTPWSTPHQRTMNFLDCKGLKQNMPDLAFHGSMRPMGHQKLWAYDFCKSRHQKPCTSQTLLSDYQFHFWSPDYLLLVVSKVIL